MVRSPADQYDARRNRVLQGVTRRWKLTKEIAKGLPWSVRTIHAVLDTLEADGRIECGGMRSGHHGLHWRLK